MSSDSDASYSSSSISHDSDLGADPTLEIERIKKRLDKFDKRLKKMESRRMFTYPKIFKRGPEVEVQKNPMGTPGKKTGGKSRRQPHRKLTSRKTRNRRK